MGENLEIRDIEEAVAMRIPKPGISVGALHTCVEEHFFFVGENARYLFRARVGQRAIWLTLYLAFAFPFLEIVYCSKFSWSFHPVDDLLHGDKEIVAT